MYLVEYLMLFLACLAGALIVGEAGLCLVLYGQLKATRAAFEVLQKLNGQLNQQNVAYADMAANANAREQEFMKRPNVVHFQPDQISQLGELLLQYVKSVLRSTPTSSGAN